MSEEDLVAKAWRDRQARCNQCDHLMSLHKEDGCNCWMLGVRAVPTYRCSCIVTSRMANTIPKPTNHTIRERFAIDTERDILSTRLQQVTDEISRKNDEVQRAKENLTEHNHLEVVRQVFALSKEVLLLAEEHGRLLASIKMLDILREG